jgi:hypothetical protein
MRTYDAGGGGGGGGGAGGGVGVGVIGPPLSGQRPRSLHGSIGRQFGAQGR